jgi:two-component system sensor histidine kinase KdpD
MNVSAEASRASRWLPALAVWALAWVAMALLQQRVDLANLAMVLVLASALATLWLPITASLALSALSVLAFNWSFVPPRFTFAVDLRQDALLLAAMLGVSWIVAGVVARQRWLGQRARRFSERVQQLQRLGEALRDSPEPAHQAGLLQATLTELLGEPVRLLVLRGALPPTDDDAAALILGEPSAHERAGLWQCLRQGRPFGPGTGAHAELAEWYFPLRARQAAFGAAMVSLDEANLPDDDVRAQAQALCDQMGLVLQRAHSEAGARRARDEAQLQQVRNALLAAISHDYRTPLAAIMGAASSLREQGERLSAPQRQRLLDSIVDETAQLARLTDNTLQLARLDAPGVQLTLDWESPEEIVGALVARLRARPATAPARARGAGRAAGALRRAADDADAGEPGGQRAQVQRAAGAGGAGGAAPAGACGVRGARPRAGRGAGLARAHLPGVPACRAAAGADVGPPFDGYVERPLGGVSLARRRRAPTQRRRRLGRVPRHRARPRRRAAPAPARTWRHRLRMLAARAGGAGAGR